MVPVTREKPSEVQLEFLGIPPASAPRTAGPITQQPAALWAVCFPSLGRPVPKGVRQGVNTKRLAKMQCPGNDTKKLSLYMRCLESDDPLKIYMLQRHLNGWTEKDCFNVLQTTKIIILGTRSCCWCTEHWMRFGAGAHCLLIIARMPHTHQRLR